MLYLNDALDVASGAEEAHAARQPEFGEPLREAGRSVLSRDPELGAPVFDESQRLDREVEPLAPPTTPDEEPHGRSFSGAQLASKFASCVTLPLRGEALDIDAAGDDRKAGLVDRMARGDLALHAMRYALPDQVRRIEDLLLEGEQGAVARREAPQTPRARLEAVCHSRPA